MMNRPALALCAALVLLAATARAAPPPPADRIGTLVSTLSKNPLWMNGIAPRVRLGRDASPSQVLDLGVRMMRFDAGALADYKIVEVRQVVIAPDDASHPMTAVLVDSDLGPKIVLMRFEQTGWWTRAYDAR